MLAGAGCDRAREHLFIMPDLFKAAQDRLRAVMRSHASSTITYRRASLTVDLLATRVQRASRSTSDNRAAVTADFFDFIVDPSELVLSGTAITPKANDEITDEIGTKYVVSANEEDQFWRPSGTNGDRIRIHTVLSESA